MTPGEHKLILTVLTRQAMLIKALVDALVANDVLKQDDIPAFGAYIDQNKEAYLPVIVGTATLYKECARALGLQTGL